MISMDRMVEIWKTLSLCSQDEFRRGFSSAKEDKFCSAGRKGVKENADFTLGWFAYYITMWDFERTMKSFPRNDDNYTEENIHEKLAGKMRNLLEKAKSKWPQFQVFTLLLNEM